MRQPTIKTTKATKRGWVHYYTDNTISVPQKLRYVDQGLFLACPGCKVTQRDLFIAGVKPGDRVEVGQAE